MTSKWMSLRIRPIQYEAYDLDTIADQDNAYAIAYEESNYQGTP